MPVRLYDAGVPCGFPSPAVFPFAFDCQLSKNRCSRLKVMGLTNEVACNQSSVLLTIVKGLKASYREDDSCMSLAYSLTRTCFIALLALRKE